MRNILQKHLECMENRNPSQNEHSQGIIKYLSGRLKLSFRKAKYVPQAEHIYCTDREKNYWVCNVLEIRNWARSNGGALVHQIGPLRSVFSKKQGIPTEEEGEAWSRNFQETVAYQRELEKKPPVDAYQEYAETGELFDNDPILT